MLFLSKPEYSDIKISQQVCRENKKDYRQANEKAANAGWGKIFQRREKMRMNFKKKSLSFFLCMMLIVAMALGITGCNGKNTEPQTAVTQEAGQNEEASEAAITEAAKSEEATDEANEDLASAGEVQVLGEGSTVFLLSVVDDKGQETLFEIHTDKETVGAALVELDLIDGEVGEFGLYVKTVNGITADYDKDGKYWAFYINGEYAQGGVDSTNIMEGESYSLKVE